MNYDPEILLLLIRMRMPFGKYEGRLLCDLPTAYLEWFERKGYPKGKLGMLLQTMHVIRTNGLLDLLEPLKAFERERTRRATDQSNDTTT